MRADSSYKTIRDLVGQPVALGAKGSGLPILSRYVLDGRGHNFTSSLLHQRADRIGRAGARTRLHIARSVRRRLEWLQGFEPTGNGTRIADDQVIGALACMVGGLIVARLIGGKDSDVVLRACREFLHRAIDKARRPPHSPQGVASRRKRSKGVRRSRG